MKRLILVLALAGAAVWAAVAVATPGQGQTNTIMSMGALQADLAFNTGITTEANGLTWQGKEYSADQLPEFLARLRSAGVTNLGEWLNLHPASRRSSGWPRSGCCTRRRSLSSRPSSRLAPTRAGTSIPAT